MQISLIFPTILSFLITFLGVFIFLPFLRKYFMQEPNSRSSHNLPKPSGGGIAFVFAITSIDLFLDNKFSLLCLPLAIIGFLDDVFILK